MGFLLFPGSWEKTTLTPLQSPLILHFGNKTMSRNASNDMSAWHSQIQGLLSCLIIVHLLTNSNIWNYFLLYNKLNSMHISIACHLQSIGMMSLLTFSLLYCTRQIDSMLPSVCSVKDHRRLQNLVRTSVTH